MNTFEKVRESGLLKYTQELNKNDLDIVFENPQHTAEDVLRIFYKDYEDLYKASTGTIESYTLGRHTRMVLDQYFKYFKDKELPVVSAKFFESLLALHDIGKPQAAIDGDLEKQYEYTAKILNDTLPQLGFSEHERLLALSLIDGDPIREFLYKKDSDIGGIAQNIRERAATAGVSIEDFWELLKTYWMVDAGSYTVDAGGNASLDRMFEFEPEDGDMYLAQHIKDRIAQLEEKIFDSEN